MKLPRLDNLPQNANYVGIRMKMTDAIIAAQLEDDDYEELKEKCEWYLKDQYMKMDDPQLQEYYDILGQNVDDLEATAEELEKLLDGLEAECKDILKELQDDEDEDE